MAGPLPMTVTQSFVMRRSARGMPLPRRVGDDHVNGFQAALDDLEAFIRKCKPNDLLVCSTCLP